MNKQDKFKLTKKLSEQFSDNRKDLFFNIDHIVDIIYDNEEERNMVKKKMKRKYKLRKIYRNDKNNKN